MKNYAYSYDPNSNFINKSQTCGSSFNCGSEYTLLKIKVEDLSKKVENLENENNNIKRYYEDARKLITLQRYILVILPIISLIIVGLVIYFFNNNNYIVFSIIGFLGLSIFTNGINLPKSLEELERKVEKLENKVNK